MAHTLEPWSSKYKTISTYEALDLAETAARLDSLNKYDRRGKTLYIEGFTQTNLQWETGTNGAGAAAALQNTYCFSGDQAVELKAGQGAGGYAGILKRFGTRAIGFMGLELMFTVDKFTKTLDIRFISVYNGEEYQGGIQIDESNSDLNYLDSAGNWVKLDGITVITDTPPQWHYVKFVLDTENGEYERALLDAATYDMEGISCLDSSPSAGSYNQIWIRHNSDNANEKDAYIDNVIVTCDEP